jgi:hypothetical protein
LKKKFHQFDFEIHKEKEMAAFRKLFLVLAAISLIAGLAQAQQGVTCVNNSGVPPLLRGEGLAEKTGDIILQCTGGVAGQLNQVNIQVFMDTNITSRLLTAASGTGSGFSEATLFIRNDVNQLTEPPVTANSVANSGAAVLGNDAIRGAQAAANSIVWLGIPFVSPGTSNRYIHITGLRSNATQLGIAASPSLPTPVRVNISTSGSSIALPINEQFLTVGFIQRGLLLTGGNSVEVRNCNGGAIAVPNILNNLLQCQSVNVNAAGTGLGTLASQFGLRFTEGFSTAFRPESASMFTPPGITQGEDFPLAGTGGLGSEALWATQGTRLRAVFNNIPAGVRIFVGASQANAGTTQTGSPAFSSTTAVLVSNGDQTLGGPLSPITTYFATNSQCQVGTSATFNTVELTVTNNSAVAIWEILTASDFVTEAITFPVFIGYVSNTAANSPGVGTATVEGSFSPVNTTATASNSAPVPRFTSGVGTPNIFTINACVTNLLFPFVTNVAGFDTGFAVTNTSQTSVIREITNASNVPPFNVGQAGPCSVNYFGTSAGGGAAPSSQVTNAAIPAGGLLSWSLSSGGNFGITATPGFSGYIIVRCGFQMAHGFAFISDLGAQRLAEGYLALVMDASMGSRTGAVSEVLAH